MSLLKPYVWAGASLHMLAVVVIFGMTLFWISLTGLSLFAEVDFNIALLIAFALSFSSTVFAVKILEDKGELSSRHGQIAIGILIMQDIFAVVFLAMSTGKIPSLWALGLLALFPLRRVLMRFMTQAGHGELLILYGFGMAFGVWTLFDLVGMKGDLGALLIGALLAAHPAAPLDAYRDTLRDKIVLGYQRAGFPYAQVTARIDRESKKIHVTVKEGPRYMAGDVVVQGHQAVAAADLIKVLTSPGPPEDATGTRRQTAGKDRLQVDR